jgi:hypothetical protein
MAQLIYTETQIIEIPEPEVDHLMTEVDNPAVNLPSAKNQRLLVGTLYTSARIARPLLAEANIGLFASTSAQPLVPDVFLSLGVELAEDWWAKKHRSYFV